MPGSRGAAAAVHEDHLVRFYRDDGELSVTVAGYLGAALAAGGTAVVVATEEHRAGIGAELSAAGWDTVAAQADGRLVMADAAELLDRFLANGHLNQSRFEAAVGELLGPAITSAQPIRIFGEMVVLLWESHQLGLALELETFWNDLASQMPFSLLCAYPARLLADTDDAGALEEISSLHAQESGTVLAQEKVARSGRTQDATRTFPAAPRSGLGARRFVAECLRLRVPESVITDALIVTGELAANALVHARTGFTVSVSWSARGVRISVSDAAPMPSRSQPFLARPGRGLGIVARAAVRWGVEPTQAGKTVWAELPTAPQG